MLNAVILHVKERTHAGISSVCICYEVIVNFMTNKWLLVVYYFLPRIF